MSVTSRTSGKPGNSQASRTTPAPRPALPGQASEVEVELRRLVDRWGRLPLDQAQSYAGRVRALVQSLADEVAQVSGVPAYAVPDLGPATVMDQLTVTVYDASAAGLTATLAEDLANLRRELR